MEHTRAEPLVGLYGPRPSWHEYFIDIAGKVAERGTCNRLKVGAVIVKNKNIITTGYNGAPTGLPHCLDVGCDIHETKDPEGNKVSNCLRTIHAEINAIIQAAKNGVSIQGADIYLTDTPCIYCYKIIINSGILAIFYKREYKLHTLQKLWEAAKLPLIKIG